STSFSSCFCLNATSTSQLYTLSLHDALPICSDGRPNEWRRTARRLLWPCSIAAVRSGARQLRGKPKLTLATSPLLPARGFRRKRDRKSTRLNSSHLGISYAVFCLKKKNKTQI